MTVWDHPLISDVLHPKTRYDYDTRYDYVEGSGKLEHLGVLQRAQTTWASTFHLHGNAAAMAGLELTMKVNDV